MVVLKSTQYSVAELAQLLGFTEASVRKMHSVGTLPKGYRLGQRVYWSVWDIEHYLETKRVPVVVSDEVKAYVEAHRSQGVR